MRKYLQNQEKHKVKKVAKKNRKKCSSWKTDGWETDESEARSDQH